MLNTGKKRNSICVSTIRGFFKLYSPLTTNPPTALTQIEIDISADKPQLCYSDDTPIGDSDLENAVPNTQTSLTQFPAPIRPESEWDDCDRAVHAAARGEALPAGWACIDGKTLAFAQEWDRMQRDRWARSGDKYRELAALLNCIEAQPNNSGVSAAAVAQLRAEVDQAREAMA